MNMQVQQRGLLSEGMNMMAATIRSNPASLLLAGGIAASFFNSSGPIQWMDNGAFIYDASKGIYFSQDLGPLSHPFYNLVATAVFDLLGPAGLSMLNSILLIPLACLVCLLCAYLGCSKKQGILAAAATVWTHTVFWVATKSEVYLLHLLLVLLTYCLYFSGKDKGRSFPALFLIGVLTGLGAGVHQLTFIVLLPLYWRLLVQHRSSIVLVLPGFVVGFFPAFPAIANHLKDGLNIFEILRMFLTGASYSAGGWEGSLFRFDAIVEERKSALIVILSLLGPQFLGMVIYPKEKGGRLLWWAATLNFSFALSYNVNDRFTFFLPGAAFFCILGIREADRLLSSKEVGKIALPLVSILNPAALLLIYLLYSAGAIPLPSHSAALPFRNDVRYFMTPYLRDRSAENFIVNYERQIPKGAVVLSDWAPWGALRSAQVSGHFLDRKIQSCKDLEGARKSLEDSRVYLVRSKYCEDLGREFMLKEHGIGYEISWQPEKNKNVESTQESHARGPSVLP